MSVFVLAVGLYLTYQANQETSAANREQQRLTSEGQITDRYTRAVEQLGQPDPEKVDVRLGAIYALERIMRDSAVDHPAVVDVLAAFVRVHAPAPGRRTPPVDLVRPPVDIQAALTVLARRDPAHDRPGDRIDLTGTNLADADLTGVTLVDADLEGASLDGANLIGSNLTGAYLFGASLHGARLGEARLDGAALVFADLHDANLNGTILAGAYLRDADLRGATLRGANLAGAELSGVDLRGADLTRADLTGVNLVGARGATTDLLRCAQTDDATRLPAGVLPPLDVPPEQREAC